MSVEWHKMIRFYEHLSESPLKFEKCQYFNVTLLVVKLKFWRMRVIILQFWRMRQNYKNEIHLTLYVILLY